MDWELARYLTFVILTIATVAVLAWRVFRDADPEIADPYDGCTNPPIGESEP